MNNYRYSIIVISEQLQIDWSPPIIFASPGIILLKKTIESNICRKRSSAFIDNYLLVRYQKFSKMSFDWFFPSVSFRTPNPIWLRGLRKVTSGVYFDWSSAQVVLLQWLIKRKDTAWWILIKPYELSRRHYKIWPFSRINRSSIPPK